jgi:3-oxoacyl-[acyl-carrier-protein] synthase II
VSAVVTGLGVLSPYGIGTDALARGSACGSLEQLLCPTSGWPSSAGKPLRCARVRDSDIAAVLEEEPRRFLNRESLLLLAAARLALADAQHPPEQIAHTGIVVSTRHAGLQDYADLFWTALGQHAAQPVGRPRVSPARGPQTGLNAPAANLSIRLGAKGPNLTLTNGAAGGIDALAYATGALESGRATTMLVGGVEVIPQVTHNLSQREGYRTTCPLPRPFDRDRGGAMLGEAGVVAVLEHDKHAQRRGARAHAHVRATATAFAPDHDLERASRRSLTSALTACSLAPQQVGAVFAAANGSIAGDAAESRALHAIFGEHTPICAVKGATADSMGAAALVQLVVAITSMQQQTIPATAGFHSPGQDIAAIRILAQPEPLPPGPVAIHAWDTMSCSATAVIDSAHKRASPPPTPDGA